MDRYEVCAAARRQERRRDQGILCRGVGVVREGAFVGQCYNDFFLNLYTMQTMMNPFHTAHSIIRSNVFDSRVRASARKYL